MFKIIKGMCRNGTLRLNECTLKGFNRKPEVDKDVPQTIKKWRDYYLEKYSDEELIDLELIPLEHEPNEDITVDEEFMDYIFERLN